MSKLSCVVVPVGQKPYVHEVENEIRSLQELVGGYIELLHLSPSILLICDEESKLKGREGNRHVGHEIIAGQFIVVGDAGESFRSLTSVEQKIVLSFFAEPEQITQDEVEASMMITFIPFD